MTRQLNRRALLGAGMLAGVSACTATPTPATPPTTSQAPPFDPKDWAN
ncbi:MAG: hypothetical protein K0R62_4378, partial [Nonomuraea muscovyensis]|nr:hypothetical protein [Nonomuraea muscovyensis]